MKTEGGDKKSSATHTLQKPWRKDRVRFILRGKKEGNGGTDNDGRNDPAEEHDGRTEPDKRKKGDFRREFC